jgi:hypothetical protein
MGFCSGYLCAVSVIVLVFYYDFCLNMSGKSGFFILLAFVPPVCVSACVRVGV